MGLSKIVMSGLLVAGSAVAMAAAASATTFDWTATINTTDELTGDPIVTMGLGTITATSDGGDQYTVTEITGTYGGETITGLDNGVGDNLVFTSAPYLDGNGIGFDLAGPIYTSAFLSSPLQQIQLLYSSSLSTYEDNYAQPETGTFALTALAVPEPGSLALVGAGAAALLLIRRKRAADR